MPARKLESEGSPNDVSRSEKSLQDDQERNGMHTADKTSLVAFVTGATGISSVHLIQVRPDLHCLGMHMHIGLCAAVQLCATCSYSKLQ